MIFCSLYSGSSGNSIFIGTESSRILIDAGMPGKHIEKALQAIEQKPTEIDGIFVTHEHIDHVKGVGILSRKYNIPIYANEPTWQGMSRNIGKIKEENIRIIKNNSINIKDINISAFNISHDAAMPSGYSICCNNKKACIATDLGYFSEEVKNSVKDADVILLESNHDIEMLKFGPYPYPLKRRILSNIGHLSNEDCGKAILDILEYGRKNIVLGHLSKTNNHPDLAYQTVLSVLQKQGVNVGKDVKITMAKRDMPSGYIEF